MDALAEAGPLLGASSHPASGQMLPPFSSILLAPPIGPSAASASNETPIDPTQRYSSNKRARADTVGNQVSGESASSQAAPIGAGAGGRAPWFNQHDLVNAVSALPEDSLRALLLGAAQANDGLASIILQQHAALKAKEQSRRIDFDYLSKSSWRTLNITYSRMRSSEQYERSYDAWKQVVADIETIRDHVHPDSSYETKKSGIVTLRKIGKSICLMDSSELAKQVHQHCAESQSLVEAMLHVMKCFPNDELDVLVEDDETDIVAKLEELDGLQESYGGLFPMHAVFGQLPQLLTDEDGGESESDGSAHG